MATVPIKLYLQAKFAKVGHNLLTYFTFPQFSWHLFSRSPPLILRLQPPINIQWWTHWPPKPLMCGLALAMVSYLRAGLCTFTVLRMYKGVNQVHDTDSGTEWMNEHLQGWFAMTASERKPAASASIFLCWPKPLCKTTRKHVSCGTSTEVYHGLGGFKPLLSLNDFPFYSSCTFYYKPLQILWET